MDRQHILITWSHSSRSLHPRESPPRRIRPWADGDPVLNFFSKESFKGWIPAFAGMTLFGLFIGGSASMASATAKNSGANFLKIPVGARSIGLGQAFTAMA